VPRRIDVDAQVAEGAIDFTVRGRTWRAPEPDIDTFKAVLMMAPPAPDAEADDETSRQASADAMDTLVPQLALLLIDPETGEHPPNEALAHLSVKRMGAMLAEILGEGPAAPVRAGGTAR
jgi:hypothetical protein